MSFIVALKTTVGGLQIAKTKFCSKNVDTRLLLAKD